MVFWILVVLSGLIVIAAFVRFAFIDDLFEGLEAIGFGLLIAFLAALLTALVSLGIVALFLLIPAGHVKPTTYRLASLGSTQGVEGRFFHGYYLGTGTINGVRQITYVKQVDGYYVVTESDGNNSRVFQDTKRPTVTEYRWYYDNPWVLPWTFDTWTTYDFHVPAGTILNEYQVGAS